MKYTSIFCFSRYHPTLGWIRSYKRITLARITYFSHLKESYHRAVYLHLYHKCNFHYHRLIQLNKYSARKQFDTKLFNMLDTSLKFFFFFCDIILRLIAVAWLELILRQNGVQVRFLYMQFYFRTPVTQWSIIWYKLSKPPFCKSQSNSPGSVFGEMWFRYTIISFIIIYFLLHFFLIIKSAKLT